MYKSITVANKQTIFDIACQEFGSIAEVFQLLADNTDILQNGIMSDLSAGMVLKINTSVNVSNETVQIYIAKNKIKIATGGATVNISYSHGINYMGIEIDFLSS